MNVTVEDSGPCRKVMNVEAPAEAVTGDYTAVVKSYVKESRIPGFRRAKAPTHMVERHYGRHIEQDVKDRLIPRLYRDALTQQGIAPVAIVDVSDVVFQKESGISFKVTVDVAPEFKIPRYKRISLKGQEVEIGDTDVDDALKRLLENNARFEAVADREVREGDLVLIDYAGECEGGSVGRFARDCSGLGEGKDFWMLIGEPEFLPGFREGLIGSRVGDEREIRAKFPGEYRVAAVAGKEAVYSVQIKGIRERLLPELSQEFLKRFEVDSESALRERINRELLEAGEARERERLKDEIAKFLLKKTTFELPQSVVAQEAKLAVRSMVESITMRGGTKEQIDERKEEIVNAATQSSTDRVRLSYVLSRIADDAGVQVQENEVAERVESLAQRYGMSADRFRSELEKRNGIEKLKSDIRGDKTLDFLLDSAKIKQ